MGNAYTLLKCHKLKKIALPSFYVSLLISCHLQLTEAKPPAPGYQFYRTILMLFLFVQFYKVCHSLLHLDCQVRHQVRGLWLMDKGQVLGLGTRTGDWPFTGHFIRFAIKMIVWPAPHYSCPEYCPLGSPTQTGAF